MADERMTSRLAACQQESEQLLTALENAETEIERLAEENDRIRKERSRCLGENARLRHLLAQSQARLLESQRSARNSAPRCGCGSEGDLTVVSEELQISLEELQMTAEELEQANAALMRANERLESQVAERTAHLEKALAERDGLLRCKDQLLHEIGHRVRDTMQVVMSLIVIQTWRSRDAEVRRALQATGSRVQAVAQVHDRLFTGGGSDRVRMDRYLRDICTAITDALGVEAPRQMLEVEAEPLELPADRAFPLGLIVTELVSNAFRHAFDRSGSGTVWVQFGAAPDGTLTLVVADDGRGMPPNIEFSDAVGLGMQIVALMVRRLKADLSVGHASGSCFTLRFPAAGTRRDAGDQGDERPGNG